MKILFLGTGAADFPENREGVDGFRRTSSALIDDTLLIDPGPWVMDAIKEFGVDVKKIKYILCTHKHEDHFCQETVDYLSTQGAEFFETKDKDYLELGGYRIEAYKGNHTIPVCHFIIKNGGTCLFYGLDGAWLQYEEIRAIWKHKPDLAVFDATVGFVEKDWRVFEHNNLNMVIEMKKSIDTDIKKYVISHMAYTLHTDHKTLASEMEKHGIITAYDGLEIEF
ncbi:MAG: MBL fold metallo-hydrolase [Ruminococcaceae bacterium]|nr:MBL fold metallo-hydrolase [Oscillospiraceae bacterium]